MIRWLLRMISSYHLSLENDREFEFGKALIIKEKIDKLDYANIKKIRSSKDESCILTIVFCDCLNPLTFIVIICYCLDKTFDSVVRRRVTLYTH